MNKLLVESPMFQLTKVDESKHECWGVATQEVTDCSGEKLDYDSSKPAFEAWSANAQKSTNGKSLGNIRYMHQLDAIGKLVDIQFMDSTKTITIGAKIVDDSAWKKVVEGVLTGFSIGGAYGKRWPDPEDPDVTRYTVSKISEISAVDLPCLPTATYTLVRADGTQEIRKFQAVGRTNKTNKVRSTYKIMPNEWEELLRAEGIDPLTRASTVAVTDLEKGKNPFPKLSALHKKMADHHMDLSEEHGKSAESHKQACDTYKVCKAETNDDGAKQMSSDMASHHSDMHKSHMKKAAMHLKLHKAHSAMGDFLGKMAPEDFHAKPDSKEKGQEEKAATAEVTKAVVTEPAKEAIQVPATEETTKKEIEVTKTVEPITKKEETVVEKTVVTETVTDLATTIAKAIADGFAALEAKLAIKTAVVTEPVKTEPVAEPAVKLVPRDPVAEVVKATVTAPVDHLNDPSGGLGLKRGGFASF